MTIKKTILGIGIIALVFGGTCIVLRKNSKEIASKKIEQEEATKREIKEKEELEKQAQKLEEEKKLNEEKKRLEEEKKAEEKRREEEKKKLEDKRKAEEEKKKEDLKKKEEANKPVVSNKEEASKPETKPEQKPEKPKVKTLAQKVAATKTASRTNQIITVIGGKVSLWNKSGNEFKESIKTSGRVGHGGMTSAANKREGDKKTPTGVYPILYGFGMGGNPGTSFQYRQITENSYFIDDVNSEYYNQWYEGTGQKGEHMITFPKQYKYGLVIGYNMSNVKGKGSAIFLHANGNGNTAGCVSIPENEMLRMMKEVKPGAQIIITTSEDNLKNY